jgi:CheY-like chemotaxis protein
LTEETAESGDEPHLHDLPPGGSETILVVDNEEPIREYLKLFLTTMGYRVLQACDGVEAVQLYREQGDGIDLVLMDVIMPNKTGSEAAIEIRSMNRDARILFVSGYPYDVINERHLVPDDAEVAMKPLAPSELALKVREMLDR